MIPPGNEYAPLAAALHGLAQIIQISRISSLIVFISEMRKVLDDFERSRQPSPNGIASLFAAYCRLVGYTTRPNFFDIDQDVGPTFTEITRSIEQLRSSIPEDAFVSPFLRELELKSCYFMVLMCQEHDLPARAGELLRKMLASEKDVFYFTWAQRKLSEISGSGGSDL